ncbi:MAG: asparagine synthase (glutamine-hydrolyzing) [Planctomycetes bacterium]|nr:asparagine synthase (glutamine-hydrolyzing) [Planctomycetota bacterium]
MCGIAGYLDGGAPTPRGVLAAMTATLVHRGPDGEGTLEGDGVGLGHRRLSIVDLAGGAQPMANEDGSVAVVFNGEIYNHLELRRELEARGHVFRTRADTEVLVHLYEERGERLVEALNGIFAFAIWDRKARRLLLARDHLGVKPLYYALCGERLIFGSELKAVIAHPGVPRRLDPTALSDYLSFLYVPAPKSIYRDIWKLPPAHTLVVDRAGLAASARPVPRRYWEARFAPEPGAAEPAAREALRAVLTAAVRHQLMADVPLGAFLSGGVDSTAVLRFMRDAGVPAPQATTIGFGVPGFDERARARRVARHLGAEHHERVVTPDALAVVDRLAHHFDEPFADASAVPTWYLSAAARERVTVALSGDGGDETHAGYRRYWFEGLEHRLRRWIPGRPGRAALGLAARLYPKADWLPRPLRARTLLQNLAEPPAHAYYRSVTQMDERRKAGLLAPHLLKALAGYDPAEDFRAVYERVDAPDPISRAQAVDLVTYLPDDILTKVDRASMAHALEVRVPLLDPEAVAFAGRLPVGLKLRGRCRKYLLKEALRGRVPADVLDGRKQGFEVPLGRWFRRELRPLAESLADRAAIAAHFRTDAVRRLVREHQIGLADHSVALWTLLVFERWATHHLGGAARAAEGGGR